MDSKFLSQWVQPGELSWGSFVIDTIMRKELPPAFPLHKGLRDWLPYEVVLADWERWLKPPSEEKK
jgi:hypothetical protein